MIEKGEGNSEVTVKSVAEFQQELKKIDNQLGQYAVAGDFLFRGLPNANWGITSTAELRLSKSLEKFSQYSGDYEKRYYKLMESYNLGIINDFKRRRFNEKNLPILETHLGILAKLRHHGCANSFIDFTIDALKALWFACQESEVSGGEEEETNGAVYIIAAGSNDNFIKITNESVIDKYRWIPFAVRTLDLIVA